MVKCLPTMRETRVQSLGWENLLEKEMATHSSILAWEIPWTWGRKESDTTEQLHFHFHLHIYIYIYIYTHTYTHTHTHTHTHTYLYICI